MMFNKYKKSILKNERGSLTVDYLFAFFLVSGLSLVIITFSATLTMVEVVQYMTFSASRSFLAGNITIEKQKEAAQKKFAALQSNDVIAPLLNGGWFEIPRDSLIADFDIPNKYPQFSDYEPDPIINLFHGVAVGFRAKILDFQVPFFGSTKKQDESGESSTSFTTTITSFLGREPTFMECLNFNEQRWNAIKNLGGNYSTVKDNNEYYVINDNGC